MNPLSSREIFNTVLSFINQTEAGYNQARIRALLQGLFEVMYPAEFLGSHMSKDDAEEWERAKKRGADEAANFVEKNFRYWVDAILFLLVIIGKDVGDLAMAEDLVPPEGIPKHFRRYNVREYKRMAGRLLNGVIDFAQLPKNEGGRKPKDGTATALFESLLPSEYSQAVIENILRKKIGEDVKYSAMRKRMNRKGKQVSEVKGKMRKPRKKA